jgi:hypothetical protein
LRPSIAFLLSCDLRDYPFNKDFSPSVSAALPAELSRIRFPAVSDT